MAAFAQAGFVEAADADARAQNGAKKLIHSNSKSRTGSGPVRDRNDYLTSMSLTSNTTAWAGPIGERGSLA
jgi:hypothetical protein